MNKRDKQSRQFFGRTGGKRLLCKKIIEFFPRNYENMIYVEAFVGAGAVFWKKEKSMVDVINDLDKDIYHIFYDMKYHGDKVPSMNKLIDDEYITRDYFFNHLKNDNLIGEERLLRNLFLSKYSFGGSRKTWKGKAEKKGCKNLIKDCLKIKKSLDNTIILNEDYKTVIKKYDSVNTLFYFDPPYYQTCNDCYTHSNIDPLELFNILKDIDGKFVLSYNKHIYIRKTFQNDFNIHEVKTRYSRNSSSKDKQKIELIITNFD